MDQGARGAALYLASASPRRRQLLLQIGVPHLVLPVAVDESAHSGEPAEQCAVRLARAKAQAGLALRTDTALPVLGADTIVVVDGEILGKPSGPDQGLAMLARLSGRSHQVLTAVALAGNDGERHRLSSSQVTFRTLSPAECQSYWDSGEPADKAGGYAVQGLAAVFISRLEGSYSGVMGLPLYETAELLRQAGIRTVLF
ncbi:MAG: septum formation inhibitor Maf [Gammaproteobacteria bacterium]|nr:septum formation inhibitor Maf [Gammaproteobacteria bacterium]